MKVSISLAKELKMKKVLSLLKYSVNPEMYCRKRDFKSRFYNPILLDFILVAIGLTVFHFVLSNILAVHIEENKVCFSVIYFLLLMILMFFLDKRTNASSTVFYVFMLGFALLPLIYTYTVTMLYFFTMYSFGNINNIPWSLYKFNSTYLILWFSFSLLWSLALLSINVKSILKSSFFASAIGILSLSVSYSWIYPKVLLLIRS